MFARQHEVPALPLPSLADTCDRFLRNVAPLVTADELAEGTRLVEQLCEPGGVGGRLQAVLRRRADAQANWLSGWWETVAYLGYREPTVLNSNPCMSFGHSVAQIMGLAVPGEESCAIASQALGQVPGKDGEHGAHMSSLKAVTAAATANAVPPTDTNSDDNGLRQAMVGAHLTKQLMAYKAAVDSRQLPPESAGGRPMCMQQHTAIVGSCRVPAEGSDGHVSHGQAANQVGE